MRKSKIPAAEREERRRAFENVQRETILMDVEWIATEWAKATLADRTPESALRAEALAEAIKWRSLQPEGHMLAALRDAGVPVEGRDALLPGGGK